MHTEHLILSVGTVLLTARLLGWTFQLIGQPRVVGEMTAGIVLGPSLLAGSFPIHLPTFPTVVVACAHHFESAWTLLFMFVVGLELISNASSNSVPQSFSSATSVSCCRLPWA